MTLIDDLYNMTWCWTANGLVSRNLTASIHGEWMCTCQPYLSHPDRTHNTFHGVRSRPHHIGEEERYRKWGEKGKEERWEGDEWAGGRGVIEERGVRRWVWQVDVRSTGTQVRSWLLWVRKRRLAKIDLVTIFDCDYWWYCTIDYVIVNYIGIHHFFHHIQWFLAINHLLSIIDSSQTSCEHGISVP